MQSLIYSVFASVQVCELFCVRVCACLQVYVHLCALQNEVNTVLFQFFISFGVWSWRWMSGPVSWEDFCCTVAPSLSPISSSPGKEGPGIWGDRLRLGHKSLPRGAGKNSDIITLRPSALWSGWRCSPATVALSWYELVENIHPKLLELFNVCITFVIQTKFVIWVNEFMNIKF